MEILIKKSAITQTLQGHVDTECDLTRITTDGQDDQAVLAELTSIGADYSIYSSSITGASGQESDIIVPEKAL